MIIRKRPKLLDHLLNTNWSKASQQGSNLNKLNRLLLTSELNIIDEKSGQSPLGLVILSQAINFNNPKQQQKGSSSATLLSSSTSSTTLSSAAAAPTTTVNTTSSTSNTTLNHSLSSILSHSSTSTTTAASSSNHATTSASQLNDHSSNTLPKDSGLFALQCQSSGLSLDQVLATSVSDLIISNAPLVERVIQLMVKAGARLDLANNDGRTPLHLAAQKSNFWALKTLLDLGAESDCRDANGLTPLYYSILERANLKVTQLLLSHQCQSFNQHPNNYYSINSGINNNDIDGNKSGNQSSSLSSCIGLKDAQGWQEVHHACKLGLDTHLEKLLYYGCDINAKIDGSGNTPLHVAAINDQINCAKVLLMRGADKTITNSSHQAALQVAVISGNMDLAEFISEHTSDQVIPFKDRPSDFIRGFAALSTQLNGNNNNLTKQQLFANQPLATNNINNNDAAIDPLSRQMSTRSALVSSQSNFQLGSSSSSTTNSLMMQNYNNNSNINHNHHSSQRFSDNQRLQQFRQTEASNNNNNKILSPLSLELIGTEALDSFPTPPITTSTSTSASSTGLNNLQQSHNHRNQNNHNHRLNADEVQHGQQFLARNPNMCIPSELNNVSPCLSQRSFATSNTTSSSGVGMDGDGTTSANDEDSASGSLQRNNHNHIHHNNNLLLMNTNNYSQHSNHHSIDQSASQHSNITVISIGQQAPSSLPYASDSSIDGSCQQTNQQGRRSSDTASSRSDTESCTDDLYSLMLDERPLVAGSIVEATSDYHSGDPNHLELHRGDLIEILNCSPELLHSGQMPRMANKPMLYGRHHCNNNNNIDSDDVITGGLFPSFCVKRTKLYNQQHGRQMKVNGTTAADYYNDNVSKTNTMNNGQQQHQRPSNIVESQSLLELAGSCNTQLRSSSLAYLKLTNGSSSMTAESFIFEEFQVNLIKTNGGFGFVLRGAKIDPESLAAGTAGPAGPANPKDSSLHDSKGSTVGADKANQHRATSTLDEELLKKNNLASLQYLDEIEPNSVADRAGLKRGDFLVAVNNHDVRLKSHEQVVRMVRESGQQVHLTIATTRISSTTNVTTQQQPQNQKHVQLQSLQMQPNSSFNLSSSTSSMMLMGSQPTYASSRTLGRIKPEPPKRDPTTTLSRNHNKSKMLMQQQQQRNDSKDVQLVDSVASDALVQPTTPKQHEDSHSMASTLSLHNTPTHNSTSSGSTQTTVEANTVVSQATIIEDKMIGHQAQMTASSNISKPEPPPKPAQMSSSHHHAQQAMTSSPALSLHFMNQPIYQPAIMTTTTRRRQSAAALVSTDASSLQLKDRANSISTRNSGDDLPPPPPPLPDFSQALPRNSDASGPAVDQKLNHANDLHRRSIQLEMRPGFASMQLDAEALRRKRSSLALVNGSNSTLSSMSFSGGPRVPELGSVAAACAAAANSRLQRQKQLQQPETNALVVDKKLDVESSCLKPDIIPNQANASQRKAIELETPIKPLPPPPLPSNLPPGRPTTQVIKSNYKNSSQNNLENMDSTNIVRQQEATENKQQQHQQIIHGRQVGATITYQEQNCQYPGIVPPRALHQQQQQHQPNPEHLILIQKQQQHLQQHKQSLLQRQPTLELQHQYHNYQQQPILVTQNNNNNKQQAQCQIHPDQMKSQQRHQQQYYIKQQQQLPRRNQPVTSQQQQLQHHPHNHHHQNNNSTNHNLNRASQIQDNWQRQRPQPDLVAQVHQQHSHPHQHRHSHNNHVHAHSVASQHLTQNHILQHHHPHSHEHSHNHLHNHQHHQLQQQQHHHSQPQNHNQPQNLLWYTPTQ